MYDATECRKSLKSKSAGSGAYSTDSGQREGCLAFWDDEKIVVYAMSLGAYDYLVKPLQMVILIEIVQKALWTTTK